MSRTCIGAVTYAAIPDADLSSAKIDNAAANGDYAPVAAVAGQVIRIYRMILVANGAVTITFKDGTGAGTALTGAMALAANGAILLDFTGEPWFVCSNNSAFNIFTASGVQVSGRIYYTQG